MFRRDVFKIPILAVVVVCLAASIVVVVPSEESDAAVSEWFSYGLQLKLTDRNYDPVRYDSISWEYSKSVITDTEPGTVVQGDRDDDYSCSLSLDPVDFPYQIVTPLFVKEIAYMSTGEVKTASFVVNVNPIYSVCYYRFMYDDVNGYMYEPVTYGKHMEVGKDFVVNLPVDPGRNGYTFGGWYYDRGCTDPFDNMHPRGFTTDNEVLIYPKWIPDGGSVTPGTETRFVTLHTVDGMYMEHNGMAVTNGSSFTFTVSILDGFKFDTTDMVAVTSQGKVLDKKVNPDGTTTFSLTGIISDTDVMLTGYLQYYRIFASLDNVSTVGFDEWALQGTSLTLPLSSTVGGDVSASVYMGGVDVTGNTYSDGTVRISSVTGNVSIYASSVEGSASDLPWEVIAIVAIAIAAILAVVMVVRHVRARDRG